MTLDETQALAIKLMRQHGLAGWDFRFNRARRRMGVCFHPVGTRPGRIELSAHFVANNTDEDIRDTILHEIAHALADKSEGHGPLWKSICLSIGARPIRCNEAVMPRGNWLAQCPGCKREHTRHQRPRSPNGYYCRACGRESGTLNWQRTHPRKTPVGVEPT
jgi:predicted SprT family Zn-dependent metalloprotease